MSIIAKFSNGHTDEYKGHRAVKAAWMIVYPSGKIESGHSMDRVKAAKTAASHIRHIPGEGYGVDRPRSGGATIEYLRDQHRRAVEAGFKNHKEAYAAYSAKLAAYRGQCKIEVVEV